MDEIILLNDGVESDEEGVCYSWPQLSARAGCDL